MQRPDAAPASKVMPKLRVGLIGCGHLGRCVLQTLHDAGFPSRQLYVTSRRPGLLDKFQKEGVRTFSPGQLARFSRR